MNDSFLQAIRAADIAPGGMKAVDLNGRELVICNCDESFYAIDRLCGHKNAPLERGTLDGTIVTCARHCAQFDVTNGQVLAGPVPDYLGDEASPPRTGAMPDDRTESIGTYETRVESGWVMVALKPV